MLPVETIDHQVPPGAVIVESKICENCTRTLFRKVDGRRLCISCAHNLESGSQVWVCIARIGRSICGTARKYGDGRPWESSAKQLRCDRCHDVTPHDFFEVSRGAQR